jgi:hypothetical protein
MRARTSGPDARRRKARQAQPDLQRRACFDCCLHNLNPYDNHTHTMKKTTDPIKDAKAAEALSISGQSLVDRIVLVNGHADPLRLFHCKGGFGCNPAAMGQAVFGTWLSDGKQERIDRYNVERFASDEEIEAGRTWATQPAKVRFEAQIMQFFDQAQRAYVEVNNPKSKRDEIANALQVSHRLVAELSHYLTSPTPDGGSNVLATMSEAWAETWDTNNKRRV